MNLDLEEAAKHGFEFKLVKGQFNQPQVTLWGFICDVKGGARGAAGQTPSGLTAGLTLSEGIAPGVPVA